MKKAFAGISDMFWHVKIDSVFLFPLIVIIAVLTIVGWGVNDINAKNYPIAYTGKVISTQYQGGLFPTYTYVNFSDGTVLTLNGNYNLQLGETYTIEGVANKDLRGITVTKISTE